MKNKTVLFLSILCAALIIAFCASCLNARRNNAARVNEMAVRLDVEEKLNKFQRDLATFEEKLKAKDKELEEQAAVLAATKSSLMQEQLINQSLKSDLEKVTKLKEKLESAQDPKKAKK